MYITDKTAQLAHNQERQGSHGLSGKIVFCDKAICFRQESLPFSTGNEMKRGRLKRLQIMLDDAELAALETWRFTKQMPSRAAAIRELLRRGLAAEGFEVANVGVHSESYGVIKTPEPEKRK